MILLSWNPIKRNSCQLLFIIVLFIVSKYIFGSEISQISESSNSEKTGLNKSSFNPDNATSLPIKKSPFDLFKKEVVVQKLQTSDGKVVKVILVRKSIPIFKQYRKWKNKRKNKKKAKKKFKMSRNEGKKDGLLRRIFKGKKTSIQNNNQNLSADLNYENENEGSNTNGNIFEGSPESDQASNNSGEIEHKVYETAHLNPISSSDSSTINNNPASSETIFSETNSQGSFENSNS